MTTKTIELTPWKPQQDQASAETGQATQIEQLISDMAVEDQASMDFAAEALRDVKAKIKELEDMRKTATKPMSEALEAVRSWFRAPIKHYKKCEEILKDKLAQAHTRAVHAQQRQLQAMAVASMAGDEEAAKQALVAASASQVQAPKGISFREKWDYKIVDFEQIPRQYLMVDHQRVMQHVREHKLDSDIPGIEPVLETSVAARSK